MSSPAFDTVLRNAPASDRYDATALVGRLSEDALFNADEFAALESALVSLAGTPEWQPSLFFVFCIYTRIADLITSCVDPDDVYGIDNLSADAVRDVRQRL